MEKKQIIIRMEAMLNGMLVELNRIKQEIEQEKTDSAELKAKIDQIAEDCRAVRKGVIG